MTSPAHVEALARHGIGPIDLVAVNLYPFEATVAKPGVGFEDAIEQIDVGGPAMIRAAAKNHAGVVVLVDPAQYAPVLEELRRSGGTRVAGDAPAPGARGVPADGAVRRGDRRLAPGSRARRRFPPPATRSAFPR